MKLRFLFLIPLVLAATAADALADITLAPLFRDGAVLQRDQPIVVWGVAAAAERVEVKFKNQTTSVIAGADGRWRVTLKPEKASATGAELVATGANSVRVREVLVGEVWLCSGQSNMAFLLRNATDAERELAAADYPLIRHFKLPTVLADKPAFDVAAGWVSCTPATAGTFSAVSYFFARELHQKLKVPIGIVNSSWGGTQIESWMSEATLKANPVGKEIAARWQQTLAEHPEKMKTHATRVEKWKNDGEKAKAAGKTFARNAPKAPEGPGSRWQPSAIYNAMIAPLVPYAMTGVLWYQGETNAQRHAEYGSLFVDMIKQWRTEFAQPLPFYFVQLANYEAGGGTKGDVWAYLRESQTKALTLPSTGMAVTIDIGETKDIHPRNKLDVAKRLALHARKQVYHENIETDGPLFSAAKREGKAMRVTFTHAAGLKLAAAKGDGRVAFEVAGEDKKFVPAEARVDGYSLVVSAPGVAAPVAVRYAWRNSPDARLFNGDGLPAAPFRSDNW
ncbi:MAG: sialate O-acetylesterase [Verrucomicrobiota bacterium]